MSYNPPSLELNVNHHHWTRKLDLHMTNEEGVVNHIIGDVKINTFQL